MISEVISCSKPTFNSSLYQTANNKINPKKSLISCNISFTSQIAKSKISTPNTHNPRGTRPKTRIQAFYTPVETTTTTETLYDVLGIAESVGPSDIKKAYKNMARKYHPDVSPPDRVDEYTNKFIMVHEAYETLSNPQRRAMYDRDLASGFRFGFSGKKRSTHEKTGETGEWKMKWESQLDDLKRRNNQDSGSWGARMRNQRL